MTTVGAPGQPAPRPVPTNGLAIAALTTGVIGVTIIPLFAGLLAAPLGAAALCLLRTNEQKGRGMAIAGFVLGIVGGVIPLAVLCAFWGDGEWQGWAWAFGIYGAVCAAVAFWALLAGGGPEGRRLAGVALGAGIGGVIAIAVGVAVVVLMAIGIVYGTIWLIEEIVRQATNPTEGD